MISNYEITKCGDPLYFQGWLLEWCIKIKLAYNGFVDFFSIHSEFYYSQNKNHYSKASLVLNLDVLQKTFDFKT